METIARFVIHQRVKWRAIDDGRASRANSGAGFTAQVHTATADGVVANVRTFYRRVLQHFGTKLPDDLAMEGSVDDETAAFRYRPTRDDDAPVLIVAVFNPELRRVQFGEMNGHPFGFGAAVLGYNRQPEVVIHTMRTVLGVCAHQFYDDALNLGLNVEKGSAQQSYHALQDLLHAKLDRGKRQLMSQIFVYIGVQISFAELLAPKPGRVEAIRHDIARYRRVDRLRPREAAELRGRAGYLGSHLAGRVTRGCEWALRQREYKKDATLSSTAAPKLNFALTFLKLILRKVPKKFIPCHPRTSKPARLYTDAMWEPPNPCGVGVVYDAPGLPAPLAFAAVIPSCDIEAFLDRFQQLNQAEAFAGIIALASLGERLRESTSSTSSTTSQRGVHSYSGRQRCHLCHFPRSARPL